MKEIIKAALLAFVFVIVSIILILGTKEAMADPWQQIRENQVISIEDIAVSNLVKNH